MKFIYKSIVLDIPDSVYPPAEDSFMLAEAAIKLLGPDLSKNKFCEICSVWKSNFQYKYKTQNTKPAIRNSKPTTASSAILEIGCGSGIVSLACAKANPNITVLGVDINPDAVACATENAKRNKIKNARFAKSDIFSCVPKNKKFDLILFNPPYLPTEEGERLSGNLNRAFDGGKDGREVVDRFLEEFYNFLAKDGTLLLVQSSLNDLEKTKTKLELLGYTTTIVSEEKFFFEKLFVIRAAKP